MPRPNSQRKVVVADTEEELEVLTAQHPGEPPEPTPPPLSPVPDPDEEDEDEDDDPPVPNPDDDPEPEPDFEADPPKTAYFGAPPGVHYESRIVIVDAWQYPGSLKSAPGWIDRNWVGYADYDELRGLEAGPCLRVPLQSGITAIVRIGDYVATQEVKLAENLTDTRLEAWQRDHFEKMFIPRPAIDIPAIEA